MSNETDKARYGCFDKVVKRSAEIAVDIYSPRVHPMEQHVAMFMALCEHVAELETEIDQFKEQREALPGVVASAIKAELDRVVREHGAKLQGQS